MKGKANGTMTTVTPGGKPLARLGLIALCCAFPFVLGLAVLANKAERIDTLPLDEYRDLAWTPDGHDLVVLHRPLTESSPVEFWLARGGTEFEKLGDLPADGHWGLTGQWLGDAGVLRKGDGPEAELALFDKAGFKALTHPTGWAWLSSRGQGLFLGKEVTDLPFDQAAMVEQAPEVEPGAAAASGDGSKRLGLVVGRFEAEGKAPVGLVSIPYARPEDKPRIEMLKESPDHRFLALVARFGDGGLGLWVFDSDANRLLWTRVVVHGRALGLDWSSSSVGLALTDEEGVVVLDNVLSVESTRYQIRGLGETKPLYGESDRLYLVGASTLYQVNRELGRAEVVFSSHGRGLDALYFSVNSRATQAAFLSSPAGTMELYVADLSPREPVVRSMDLPGSRRRLAQQTLGYQVGNTIRTAWRFWWG